MFTVMKHKHAMGLRLKSRYVNFVFFL